MTLSACGLVCVVWAVIWTATWRPGMHMALDLWVAAGLIRLTGDPEPADLLVAAAVIAIRQLVGAGLRSDDRALSDSRQHG